MDPPPSSGGTAPAATQPLTSVYSNYADPAFSPRSRSADSWDEPAAYSAGQGGGKLRVMCSYGGNIVPRPHDKSLCYVGGDTRIIVADRNTSLSELSLRLSKTLLDGRSFSLKYQLPNEDLDSLISVTTDEDFENMIDEYDRISANSTPARASRLRLFLFPSKPEAPSSIGSPIESSTKSDDCVLDARNGANCSSSNAFSGSSMVNCLLGLGYNVGNRNFKDAEGQLDGSLSGKHGRVNSAKFTSQDVHSVPPDSPMVEITSSSFGSSSSSSPSSMGNLPPQSQVHVDENHKLGIEEQLSQMTLLAGARVEQKQKQQREEGGGFRALSSPPAPQSPHIVMVGTEDFSLQAVIVGGEYPNRGFCDGERSDQVVYRKPPQAQQPVQMMQPNIPAPPDSISSEGSITNPLLGQQKHYIYHEPVNQIQPVSRASSNPADLKVVSDQSTRPPAQQHAVEDSVYILPNHCDHQHPQMYHHQHQQQPHAHSGQFIPAGAVPVTSYYHHPLYHSQNHPAFEHHQHQYPVYFMQARPTQPYNLHSVQQASYSEPAVPTSNPIRPQTPSSPSFVHTPAVSTTFAASNPEIAARTAPQWVQMASGQHPQQYFGFSHMHHPPQASAATTATYAYEFTDHPTNAQQMYYTQPLSSHMVSVRAAVLPEASYQIPVENFKQQS
ncbi:unnamed protein product [Cuscuta europaea]|uniref:PB1 domain-containing protein n=1 Tax=Cuscuta europaea TaxID=41803 RepID=A0A9P0ZP27_CUSEU|nr:unnamed protein product [Cuscuta europaea]